MIGATTAVTDSSSRVAKAADAANFRNIFHAAATIRKRSRAAIERAPKGAASTPGTPPHTHRGAFLKRAVLFFVDKQRNEALIGFSGQLVGDVGAVHEFGQTRRGRDYPQRPTLGPVLDAEASRLGDQWRGSIGA